MLRLWKPFLWIAMVGVVLAAIQVDRLRRRALSAQCFPRVPTNPTMEEILAVRRRVGDYQRSASRDARLFLTDQEVNFLIGESSHLPFRLRVEHRQVEAWISIPRTKYCYNLYFRGLARIRAGVVELAPWRLRVGEIELTPWVTHRTLRIAARRIPDHRLRAIVENTATMDVQEGRIWLKMENPGDLW